MSLFLCDAIYHGSKEVIGVLTPSVLSSLADSVLFSDHNDKNKHCLQKLLKGDKCQLQIDEKSLKVNCNKNDEGFESDSDASSNASMDRFIRRPDNKGVDDHVLRLEKLIKQDVDSSRVYRTFVHPSRAASLSSSSGAESEEEVPTGRGNFDGIPAPSTSTSIESAKREAGICNTFWMKDILFCHVLPQISKVVVVVVKLSSTSIAAHIFECVTAEAAKTLYNSYNIANNKYKLNKYRVSGRRNDKKYGQVKVSISSSFDENDDAYSIDSRPMKYQFGDYPDDYIKSNITGNNVNVIEIRDRQRYSPIHRVDSNGVTHIEISSSPYNSLTRSSSTEQSPSMLSALDKLSIHSTNNPDSYLNYSGVTSSCPNSLIVTTKELSAYQEKDRKVRPKEPYIPEEYPSIQDTRHYSRGMITSSKDDFDYRKDNAFRPNEANFRSESLSRKEIRRKNEKRNRSKSEERKSRMQSYNTPRLDSSFNSRSISPKRYVHEISHTSDKQERQSRSRSVNNARGRTRSSHGKRQAPPPPPRMHPENPSLILVPTKTGQEPSTSYYPKESHIMGSKLIHINHQFYPPWNMNADINNNPRYRFSAPYWTGSREFHARQSTEMPFSEMRRRSRSKSPARKPMSYRYIDATLNISQKLKDFSESVRNTIKPGTSQNKESNNQNQKKSNEPQITGLRSVIKRNKKDESGETRRVTFNSYATVQVMD